MGAKVNITRIINHYRFNDPVKRPDISKCAYSREQLERDFPQFIKLRDEHFAKKVKIPAASQAASAPARAVEMVAAAATAAACWFQPFRSQDTTCPRIPATVDVRSAHYAKGKDLSPPHSRDGGRCTRELV